MPTKTVWVNPKLFVMHKRVRVYHTYKDDDFDQGESDFYFTLTNKDDEPEHHFDVRKLSTYVAPQQPPYLTGADNTPKNRRAWDRFWPTRVKGIKTAVIEAIEAGIITQEGVRS